MRVDETLIKEIISETINDLLINEGFLGGLSALNKGFQERNNSQTIALTPPPQFKRQTRKISFSKFRPSSDRILDMLSAINDKIETNSPNITKIGNNIKTIGKSIGNKDYRGLYDRYSKFANDMLTDDNYDVSDNNEVDDDEYDFSFLKRRK